MTSISEIVHEIDAGAVPDDQRRRILLAATRIMGGVGLVAAAYPFVAGLEPSARDWARGGPVTGDLAGLFPGGLRIIEWRGKPVWLLRRSDEMVRALQEVNPALADPLSKRSEQPDQCDEVRTSRILRAVGVCTHLGCSPTLRLDDEALNAELHAPGGFLCPCHGSRFDLAGRVVKNVPAPTNLEVPNYRFTSPTTVRIG